MKDVDGRRRYRLFGWGSGLREWPEAMIETRNAEPRANGQAPGPGGSPGAMIEEPAVEVTAAAESAPVSKAAARLGARIGTTAFAFRGYDQTNLGRSAELLAHPVYGPIVRDVLGEASEICSESIGRSVDLAAYVRMGAPSSLHTFPEDVSLVVGMELAQVRILEAVFHVPVRQAKLSFGYSIGELTALVLGGVYRLDQILPVPLHLAEDCARLAADTSMGVLFTRGPELDHGDVERLCEAVRSEGQGLIGPSAYLSPNTALILGQGDTLSLLERMVPEFLPEKTMLRRKEHRWPPLHSPLVWAANIPNRTAMALYKIGGGRVKPSPTVISCVTGAASYDDLNSRETLIRWTDQPQQLWDVIDATLGNGAETVIHVGPHPNLIPSTFQRLSNNVRKQTGQNPLQRFGRGMMASMSRYAWLAHLLPSRATLLRAPLIEHIVLEDWLLEQSVG